jgi:hypothetical protein
VWGRLVWGRTHSSVHAARFIGLPSRTPPRHSSTLPRMGHGTPLPLLVAPSSHGDRLRA